MSSHSPRQPVQRFAEIMSALSDPFADRAAVLGAVGYDATGWARVEREWTASIANDASGELGRAYAEAFSRSAAEKEDASPGDDASTNRTVEIPCLHVATALPFRGARPDEESGIVLASTPCRAHEPPIRPASRSIDATESTTQIPTFAPEAAVLPFGSAGPPYRRLHRFDSQTGAPLRNPIWIEVAAASDPTTPR